MNFSKLSDRACLILILVVGMAAHWMCLGAEFYMDDFKYRSEEYLAFDGGWQESKLRVLSALPAVLTNAVFPGSRMALHVWNLLIHLGLALVVFWGAREFLRAGRIFRNTEQLRLAALFGALVFACHPICSEAVNYARCTMIQLVALFSVLSAILMLKFCQRPDWRTGLGVLLVVAGAALSKEPGIVQAVGNVVVVAMVFGNWDLAMRQLRRPIDWVVAALGTTFVFMVPLGGFTMWWVRRADAAFTRSGLDFWEHALTQGRIFWEYARRVVLPTDLSVDHHIALTRSMADVPAVVATGALVLLVCLVLWMMFAKRLRLFGGLAMLGLSPILVRFLYPISELMVEYRVYPAMPWIAILTGAGLAFLYQKNERVMRLVMLALLLAGVGGSMLRSMVWQDAATLAQNVVDQYPTNNRARGALQRIAYEAGDYDRVLELRSGVLEAVALVGEVNSKRDETGRAFLVHRTNGFYLSSEARVVLALAEAGNSRAALALMDLVEAETRAGHPDYFDPEHKHYAYIEGLVELRELIRVHGAAHDQTMAGQASVVDPDEP